MNHTRSLRRVLAAICILALVLCPIAVFAADEKAEAETLRPPALSTAVSVLAEQSPLIKTGGIGKELTFTLADFQKALGVTRIESITVVTLPKPEEGVLSLSNLRVSEGQTVKAEHLSLLRFVPATPLVTEASFGFTADGYAGGAVMTARLRFTNDGNRAPQASGVGNGNLSVLTQKSVSVYGEMEAIDADGDRVSYEIISYPKRGLLTVLDRETGAFRYTPFEGFTGKDSFTYVARDEYGSYSNAATVDIRVERRQSDLVYSDMQDNPSYNAALLLTELGVMSPDIVNGIASFNPDTPVTREEFTVMVLKAAGVPIKHYTAASFEDSGEIAPEHIAAVSTAHVNGYINGSLSESGLFFRPKDAITAAEAATVLCRVYGISLPGDVATFAPDADVPVWAAPAMTALQASGILTLKNGESATEALSRADVADILYNALRVVK